MMPTQRRMSGDLINTSPRAANDVWMLAVACEDHYNGIHKGVLTRRFRVLRTFLWLRQNDSYYRNVEIDNAALQTIPESGQLTGLLETVELPLFSAREGKRNTARVQNGATGRMSRNPNPSD